MDLTYRYGGAGALVALHDHHLREFLAIWRQADERRLELPASSEPEYASREALLAHVLGCAAGYLGWICRQLELPQPAIERPAPEHLAATADGVLERILEAWQTPLRSLTEERAYHPAHPSPWGPPYCIDAMLEHAVMHPIRHSHQLRRLMAAAEAGG